jgi:hypothetical protein
MEVAINGLELTPGRRGGDRATLVVSGRGRGVDATVLEVQRPLLMKRRRIMRARNVVATAGECWHNEAAASGRSTVRAEEVTVRTMTTWMLCMCREL